MVLSMSEAASVMLAACGCMYRIMTNVSVLGTDVSVLGTNVRVLGTKA